MINKIVFISNFLNQQLEPLCEGIKQNCNKFVFISTKIIPDSFVALGHELYNPDYLVKSSNTLEDFALVKDIIASADVCIIGACPKEYLDLCIKENKIIFVYSERVWKKGTYRRFIPFIRKKVTSVFDKKNPNIYALAASCFLPYDLSLIHFPTKRIFQWGYFTATDNNFNNSILNNKDEVFTLLSVGRFVKLKRIEDVLKACKVIDQDGFDFKFKIIGEGRLSKKYISLIKKYNLQSKVTIVGKLSQREVKEQMKDANALILSSDYREGWGTVLNECMNEYCIPIVSSAAGSSAYLVDNKKCGYIYKVRDVDGIVRIIEDLINNKELKENMAIAAKEKVVNEYNGTIAGERLCKVAEQILKGDSAEIFSDGVMSVSKIYRNKWYSKKI